MQAAFGNLQTARASTATEEMCRVSVNTAAYALTALVSVDHGRYWTNQLLSKRLIQILDSCPTVLCRDSIRRCGKWQHQTSPKHRRRSSICSKNAYRNCVTRIQTTAGTTSSAPWTPSPKQLSVPYSFRNVDMTPKFTSRVFDAAEATLSILGDRFLHLSDSLPAPRDLTAIATNFRPFSEDPILDDNDEYNTSRRKMLRSNINALYATPTRGDVNLWRLTRAGQTLMCSGGYLLASKNMVSEQTEDEWLDEDEQEWREELLRYAVLTLLGIAHSLSDGCGGRQVKVWDEVLCGTTVG